MGLSNIEWTDYTFNPWIGCTKVSPGCAHCYAETRDQRFAKGIHWGPGAPRQRTSPANWKLPLKWNRTAICPSCGSICSTTPDAALAAAIEVGCPRCNVPLRRPRVFCASLADWLDDEVKIEDLADLLKLIHDTPNLDWQLLTKRPENFFVRVLMAGMSMMGYVDGQKSDRPENFSDAKEDTVESVLGWSKGETFPANVWIGTTVEDQQRADERIPQLLAIPAKVRFLSCEPLLGPVDLELDEPLISAGPDGKWDANRTRGDELHWVICGGESGPGARPMHPDWARSLRDQCLAAGVPFFFKQWGEWAPDRSLDDGPLFVGPNNEFADSPMQRVGKKDAGRLLDGREWSEFPKVEVSA